MKGGSTLTVKGEDHTKLIHKIKVALDTTPKGANRDFLEMFLETLTTYKTTPELIQTPKPKDKKSSIHNIFSEIGPKKEKKPKSGFLNGFGLGTQKKSRFTVIPCNLEEDNNPYHRKSAPLPQRQPIRPKTEEELFIQRVKTSPHKLKYPFDKVTDKLTHMSTIHESC